MAEHSWGILVTLDEDETWLCSGCGALGGGTLGTPNPSFQGVEVSSDCYWARLHISKELLKVVPGIIVEPNGTGVQGGTGRVNATQQFEIFVQPFFIRRANANEGGLHNVEGLYVAEVLPLRYQGTWRTSAPLPFPEAVSWLIAEYLPVVVPEGPRKSAWEHLLEAEERLLLEADDELLL
jgi:hypothetical protein